MGLVAFLKDASILFSIVGLVIVGFLIAVRSEAGATVVAKGLGMLRTFFAVSCVIVVLMMAQSVIGFHVGSRW